jgi:IPT/TIG domain-containing protein
MSRLSASVRLAAACLALGVTTVVVHAAPQLTAAKPTGVSLKIGKETVPPGGLAQVKLFITEPKPISTGFASFDLDGLGDVVGIALMSPAHDTLGVAIVRGSQLAISILSPSATYGTDPDYPVLTIAGRVPATTPNGTVFSIAMDGGSLQFTDPTGTVYPNHFKGGSVLVAPNVGIDDVVPGSADVNAGDVVTVVGRGFVPDTKVKFKEVLTSATEFVDAAHMRVTVAQPARMHGLGVQVVNPAGGQTSYFSYLRTKADATSLQATLRDAVPVFADIDATTALVDVAGTATGLAIQNRQPGAAQAIAELFDAAGRQLAATTVTVPSHRYLLLELSELFGRPYAAGQIVRVRSLVPVQVMGVAVDAAGGARPLASR